MVQQELPKYKHVFASNQLMDAIKAPANVTKEDYLADMSWAIWKNVLDPSLTVTDANRNAGNFLINIIRKEGGGTFNFKTVREASAHTGYEKLEVDDKLRVVAAVTYLAVAEAPANQVVDITVALGRGSSRGVDDCLPDSFKGLGERMVAVLVPDDQARKDLRILDLVRSRTEVGDETQKENLRTRVVELADKLKAIEDDWAGVVAASLDAEARELEPIKVVVENTTTFTQADSTGSPLRAGRKDAAFNSLPPFADTKNPLLKSMMSMSENMSVGGAEFDVQNAPSVNAWIMKTVVEQVQRNPLAFAGWWQSGMCQQMEKMIGERLDASGMSLTKMQGVREQYRKMIYATSTAIGYLGIMQNADQSMGNLKGWAPPAEMADAFRWSEPQAEVIKNDPLLAACYKRVFDMAYELKPNFEGRGWEVVDAVSLKDGDMTKVNAFCEMMTREIMSKKGGSDWKKYADKHNLDPKDKQAVWNATMIALDAFWVEEGAEYINYLNKTRRYDVASGNDDRRFEWFQCEPGEIGESTREVAIAYSANGVEGKMQWSHPVPVYSSDVYVIKGAYNPEIRRGIEDALMPFVRMIFATGLEGELIFKPLSKLHQKNPSRYDEFVSKLTGGPQLTELDTPAGKEFGEAVAAARNIWKKTPDTPITLVDLADDKSDNSSNPKRLLSALKAQGVDKANRLRLVDGVLVYQPGGFSGKVKNFEAFMTDTASTLDEVEDSLDVLSLSRAMSEIFKVKGDALFSGGYRSGATQIVLGLLKLDRFTGQGELDRALRELQGATLTGSAGIFRDMDRTFGINMTAYNGARDTVVRLMMDEPDVEKAHKALKLGRSILWSKLVGALVGGGAGGKKR